MKHLAILFLLMIFGIGSSVGLSIIVIAKLQKLFYDFLWSSRFIFNKVVCQWAKSCNFAR